MAIAIGLKNLYYALLLTDPIGGVATYTVPKRVKGVTTANMNPNVSKGTFFGDDGPMEVAANLGQIDLELVLAELPLEDQAILLGHDLTNGVLTRKSTDVAPWVAVGYETAKTNGSRRFVWFVKGKFQEPEQNSETKNDSVNFQAPTINASFVMRDSDDVWELHADEDAIGYTVSVGNGWFSEVYDGSGVVALSATVVPANAATAVVVSGAKVTWTFNQALNPAFVSSAYFKLYKTAGLVELAGTLGLDVTKKIVTFTPSVALTAATGHTAKVLTGFGLAAEMSTTFTTA